MADTREWENTAAGNNKSSTPDFPVEGQDKATVNNTMRENMASVRRHLELLPWLQLVQAGDAVTKITDDQVQIAGADYTAIFATGDRCRVGVGGTTVEREIASLSFATNTTITFATGELAAGINLTFADADPDTITSASGTPFGALTSSDQVRVEGSVSNDGTFRVASATSTVITLNTAEALAAEGPVAAEIYLFDTHFPVAAVPVGANSIELFVGSSNEAAHRNVGAATGEIPLIDDLGDGALLNQGTLGGFDADTVDAKHYTDIQTYAETLQHRNLLVNPEFRFWQDLGESPTAQNDLVYVADQWKLLADTNACVTMIRTTTRTELPDESFAGLKATQLIVDTQWALCQMIETRDFHGIRNKNVSASVKVRLDAGSASPDSIGIGIIVWNGTADAPTAGPITSFNAVDAVPTLASGYTFAGSSFTDLVAGSVVECKVENVGLGSPPENAGLLIWVNDLTLAVGAGSVLTFSAAVLAVGERVTPLPFETDDEQLKRCQRYYWKTFAIDTVPAVGVAIAGSLSGHNDTLDDLLVTARLPVRMHSSPTVTMYGPGSATGSDKVSSVSGLTGYTLDSEVDNSTPEAIDIHDVTASVPPANTGVRTHIKADATFW